MVATGFAGDADFVPVSWMILSRRSTLDRGLSPPRFAVVIVVIGVNGEASGPGSVTPASARAAGSRLVLRRRLHAGLGIGFDGRLVFHQQSARL